jgi:phospholipase/carboxylesterase
VTKHTDRGSQWLSEESDRSPQAVSSDESARAQAAEPFLEAVGRLGGATLTLIAAFEQVARRLHPPELPSLRAQLEPVGRALEIASAQLRDTPTPDGLEGLAGQLLRAADHGARAVELFAAESPAHTAVARVLEGMHEHCLAQEAIFALCDVFPPVHRFFLEPAWAERALAGGKRRGDGPQTGILSARNAPHERGGFHLFVPEHYDVERSWPLLIALHGGSGHGADFLWTWLREARSRGCLLLAPTSQGSTWSFNGPDVDGPALISMIDYVKTGWRVDEERVLLSGLSDGATYSLYHGLGEGMPYTAIAPVSGVLHPANLVNGNLERASGRRIRLVHGALDWMFPVQIAREAADLLREAGAELVYREIEDLSHAYPREENARILEWLDPALSAPVD